MVQMNFKKMEVSGATKAEALAKAPFEIHSDATQAYKLWKEKHVDGVTEDDKLQFMLNQLNKKTKNAQGLGLVITIDPAVADTRERPYTIVDKKNEQGTRKYKRIYEIVDIATDTILARTDKTKAVAKELVKELYTEDGFKGDVRCVLKKEVQDGEPVAFEAKYTPSKNAHIGTYLVFGFERA